MIGRLFFPDFTSSFSVNNNIPAKVYSYNDMFRRLQFSLYFSRVELLEGDVTVHTRAYQFVPQVYWLFALIFLIISTISAFANEKLAVAPAAVVFMFTVILPFFIWISGRIAHISDVERAKTDLLSGALSAEPDLR